MDEGVGFLFQDYFYRFEEVVVDLLLAEVHATRWIEAAERSEAEMGVGDVDYLHLIVVYGILWDIRGRGVGVKMRLFLLIIFHII